MGNIERDNQFLSLYVFHSFMGLRLLFYGLVLCLLSVSPGVQGDGYCYSTDSDKYLLFSTITKYDTAREKNPKFDISGCSPVQLWWLTRSGTRTPESYMIGKMLQYNESRDFLSNDKTEMCEDDIKKIMEATFSINASMDGDLTPAGEVELQMLGKRVHDLFPDAFRQNYTEQQYTFGWPFDLSVYLSARKFAEGLFQGQNVDLISYIPMTNLILPLMSCDTFVKFLSTKYDECMEHQKNGSKGIALVADVNKRLGLQNTLKFEAVKVMYDTCRFDNAMNGTEGYSSPWCAVFTKDQLQFLEYNEDLLYYVLFGYGNEMSGKLACPLVKDMFERFQALAEGATDQPSGVFYFTTYFGLLQFLTGLGFYRDDVPLSASNMDQQKDRRWRTSLVAPYAGNLGAIFLRCEADKSNKVLFLGNERPIEIPNCANGLCPWEIVYDLLKPRTQCDLDFCDAVEEVPIAGAIPLAHSCLFVVSLLWIAAELMSLILCMK